MMAGDIDAFPIYPAPENLAQFEADPRFQVIVGSTEGETILAMNNARAPFDDIRVREAVAHAIDRQAIIDGAMFGYGTPIGSHFAPHHPAYEDLTGLVAYDPEKAKALLAEAGLRRRVRDDADAAAAGLRPARRRDHRGAAARGRHRGGDRQRRMGAVARAGVQGQGLRPDHHQPHRADGHRIYARPDYYFGYDDPVMRALIEGARRHRRRGRARRDPAGGAGAGGRALRQRLPVPAPQDRRRRREAEGLWENSPTQANDMTGVAWAE